MLYEVITRRWHVPAHDHSRPEQSRARITSYNVCYTKLLRYGALSATLGNYYVNDFNKYGRTWQVLMSAEPEYRRRPDAIGDIYVRSNKGEMVPLRSLATVRFAAGPDLLTRFNNLPAVKLLGQGAPGVSSGQAIAAVERIAGEVLPPDFSYDWGGASYQEKKSSGTSVIALGLAVVMVFLILAAQYGKWSLPFTVLVITSYSIHYTKLYEA